MKEGNFNLVLLASGISNVRNMSCDGWYSPSSPIPRITSNVRGITVFSTEVCLCGYLNFELGLFIVAQDHPFTLSSEGALERLHEIALFNATHVGVQVRSVNIVIACSVPSVKVITLFQNYLDLDWLFL